MNKKIMLSIFAVVLLLVGCSNDKSSGSAKNTYKHALGEVAIKDNPKVVSDYYLGELLKIDVDVVGANMGYVSNLLDTKGIEEIGESYEKIAALKPDLIVTINKDKYQKYSEIAPTVYLEYGKYNPEETMVEFGKLFNKTKQVDEWLTNFNKSTDELKNKITNKDETYSIMKLWDKDIWIYGENWGHGGYIIYEKLGLKAPEKVTKEVLNKKESYANISLENLPAYSGSTILAMDFKDDNDILNSKIFKSLAAYKNNKIHYLDSLEYIHVDPYSLDDQVKKLSEILISNEK